MIIYKDLIAQLWPIVREETLATNMRNRSDGSYSEAELVAIFEGQSGPLHKHLSSEAEKLNVPHAVDLSRIVIDLKQVVVVPRQVAREHRILPLFCTQGELFLAMADPQKQQVIEEIEFVSGQRVAPCLANADQLVEALGECLGAAKTGERWYVGKIFRTGGSAVVPGHFDEGQQPVTAAIPGVPKETARPVRTPEQQAARAAAESAAMPDGSEKVTSPPPPEVVSRVKPPRPANPTILVVDDEDDIRKLLARVLKTKKFEVLQAADGNEALAIVLEKRPDVMIIDAMLPGLHGFEVCRRVRANVELRAMPIIVVSAIYNGWRLAEDLKNSLGVEHFLEKPFKVANVLDVVDSCFAGSEPPVVEIEQDDENLVNAALALYESGDVNGAIKHCLNQLESHPDSFNLRYYLGLFHGRNDNYFEGIEALEQASRLQPENFSALKNLAVLYESAGFENKAFETWERCLSTDPEPEVAAEIRERMITSLNQRR